MTAAEFRKARRGLDLTQEELARALGTTIQTISVYENSRRDIPHIVAVAVLYMVTFGMLEGVMDGAPVWRLPS